MADTMRHEEGDRLPFHRFVDTTAQHSELHELLQTSTNGNDAAIARMREFMHMTTEEGLYADFDPAARLFAPPRR